MNTDTLSFSWGMYSDLHKDVYGHRPRNWDELEALTPEQAQREWDYLIAELRNQELLNAQELENGIKQMMSYGATTREQAFRWLEDSGRY